MINFDRVPAGYHLEWVPDDGWKLADLERKCRMKGCDNQGVAALRRDHRSRDGQISFRWWYYCESHMYGRRIEDGVVKMQRLVENGELLA